MIGKNMVYMHVRKSSEMIDWIKGRISKISLGTPFFRSKFHPFQDSRTSSQIVRVSLAAIPVRRGSTSMGSIAFRWSGCQCRR